LYHKHAANARQEKKYFPAAASIGISGSERKISVRTGKFRRTLLHLREFGI